LFYWVLKTLVLGPILRLLFRPWVEGEENIPPEGAAIFASNHLSFSDSIFLPLVLPRRITFLAKADYFNGRGASRAGRRQPSSKAPGSCRSTAPAGAPVTQR